MHRLFLGLSFATLAIALVLPRCENSNQPALALAQVKDDDKVPPGEAKPIPPGEARPIGKGDPIDPDDPTDSPLSETKTDPDTLPVLPKLTAPTGQEKYEAAVARAFLLMAEKKDKEALSALQEAQAAQETDFVKTEIQRLQARITRQEAAQKAADDIKEVLDAGQAAEAAKLASDALAQYGDSDVAESISGLKRQADALVGASLEDKARGQKFLDEAEAARKANNLRTAVLAYEQAVSSGADPGELKETYDTLRGKLVKYDEGRTKAAELRKDPQQLEQTVTVLKVAAENWDTPQVRQEISEVEVALNNRRDRVAVADFEEVNDIGVTRAGHIVAEELVGHMRPRFDVVERSQVKSLMEEMKLDNESLLVNDTGRTEFGRLAKARYVVVGSVNRLSGIHVNARLVDTQTGMVVQSARIVAATPEEMTNRLPALGRMLQMNDDEKRDYERQLAEQARPVTPPAATAELPPPPPPPAPEAAPAPPPPPIVVYTPRPPEYGRLVVADFDGFRVVAVGAPPPPPVVVVDAPVLVRDRAFFVAVELGDNCFRRGDFRLALRHFEFAMSLNPGHSAIRLRVMQCRPLCPPPVVFVPVVRPRLVVLPFAEFRDPFAIPSSIPPGLGVWTAEAIAPYYAGRYDLVSSGELYWWMGRLGLTMRDVLTDPYARLCLGRALGARYCLMGSLREVASFDATTHIIDAELNAQTLGARIRVNNAAELRYRLAELANLTFLPPQQQVVIVQQQQVVQRQVVAAQVEFRKGNFSISLGFYREVLAVNPSHVEARSMLVQLEYRQRQADIEAARVAAWQQQQVAFQAQRERQIALAAATQGAREQARRDRELFSEYQKHQLAKQQQLAQENLILRAQLAQRQNNFEQRVALLESAIAIQRTEALAQQLAQARSELAVERQKRLAAEQVARAAQLKQTREVELAKVQPVLAAAAQKQQDEFTTRQKAETIRAQAEFDRFIDLGKRAQENGNYPAAVGAFQNARRLKPSPEAEALVTAALNEQAKAEALKKGDAEKKKLEAQLAQEEQKSKQLEEQNAKLRTKYQTTLAKAQSAMKEQKFDEAVTSFRLASQTMQTDEAEAGLKQAQAELNKAKAATDAEVKKKSEEDRKLADLQKRRTEARTALAAKQYDKAVVALRAAATIKPDDVDLQKELSQAEQQRSEALAAKRKQEEAQEAQVAVRKLVAAGQENLKAKQYDAALVAFADALKLDAANAEAKAGLQQAQAGLGSTKLDAAAQVEAKKKRDAYETAIRQGRAALNLKQYAEALASFQKAQEFLPGDAASAELIKEATRLKGDAESTIGAQKKAAELTQAIAAGRAALRTNKFDEAQAAAERAAKLNPDSADVKKLAADIEAARKAYAAAMPKKDDAKQASDAQAKLKQAAYETAMRAAQSAIDAKQFDVAIAKSTEALRLKPGDEAATRILAAARKADAAADATAMDAKKKQDAYLAALREASTSYAAKKYDAAISSAKEALALKPGDATATKILNDAQRAMDAADAAAMEATKKKDTYDAAMKAGRAALAAKEYDAAIRAFNQALAADPGDPAATALSKQARDAQTGMADARRKELYDAWMDRAGKLITARNYEDAVEAYQNALKAIPGDAAATKGVAAARAAMSAKKDPPPTEPIPPKKDPPPKKDQPPAKGDPNAARIADLLKTAGAQEDASKYAEAYRTYQEVLKLAPANAEAKKRSTFSQWMDQGSRQLAAGKLAEAEASFEQALKIDPADENAKKMLQQARPKKKKK